MTTLDCGDAFYGEGFETGALIDVNGTVYESLLCVRTPKRRTMRLYVRAT